MQIELLKKFLGWGGGGARPELLQAVVDGWPLAEAAGITTPLRVQHFMAQVATETGGLHAIEEDLNYSAERLVEVWPSRFRSLKAAAPYAHQPAKLANKVYANRYGNGPAASGDGWRFRGGGFLMTTFRENYRAAGHEADPDALRTPGPAFAAAVKFWTDHNLNRFADADDEVGLRKAINGGSNGLTEAKAWLKRARPVFTAEALGAASAPPLPRPNPVSEASPPPAAVPATAAPAAGPSPEAVRTLQRRLQELGYHEVGEADGKLGKRTEAAILAFRNEHGLPLGAGIDDAFLAAIAIATPRQEAEARAEATAAQLRPQSPILQQTRLTRWLAGLQAGGAAVIAAVGGIAGHLGEATDRLGPVKAFLTDVPGWVWFAGAAAIAFGVWRASQAVEAEHVEQYREGRVT